MFKTFHRFIRRGSLAFLLAVASIAPSVHAAPATQKPLVEPTVVDTAFDFAQNSNPFKYTAATVTLTALGTPADLPKVVIGRGLVRMEGDLLQGKLDLTFDNAAKAKPGKNQLLFNVSRTNRVGLQWLIDDKPLNYASMKAFDAKATPDALTAKINWNGADWLMTATLENKRKTLDPNRKPGGDVFTIPPKDDKDKKPLITILTPGTIKPAKKAVGRIFVVTGRFIVTNSDDGFADSRVELSGVVSIGGKTALTLIDNRAEADTAVSLNRLKISLRYDDPNFHYCKVKGSIHDFDSLSDTDMLWKANQSIDLAKIMESQQEFLIKGDRDSESGDLYIRVTDGGEIME